MSEKNVKRPRLTCPADLPSFVRALWRNPANSHFLAKLERDQFSNLPVSSVEEAAAEARRLSASGANVYLACAEYKSHESRKASNVEAVWDFWIDADCGEAKTAAGTGHATFGIARDALSKCVAEIGIPEPTFVLDTGGGLHAHWALETGLDPVRWKAIAEKFKKVLAARGLLADPSRTADIASVMRLPNTLNFKYDPARPVTLVESSSEYIDTDVFCRLIEEAHARLCPAQPVAPQPRAMVAMDRPQGQLDRGTVDLEALRAALATLDPDCDDETWKLRRIAPAARHGRDHPEYAEPLRNMLMEWSRGDLWHTPSRKWLEPGGNGRTGEQIFPEVWDRFLHEQDRDGSVITLGTIFHDARPADGPTDVLPAEPLSHLQSRYGLILQGGDLYGVRLIDGDPHQLFIKERAFRRLMRRDLKKRFPEHDPGPIVEEFFDHPGTTIYRGVYCHPNEERRDRLNLWRGPTLEPKPGDCKLILAFLRDVICDGDGVLYEYLLNWLAHLLQRPEDKPGVIIILIGGQGIGKGTFGYLLKRIFGDGYLHVGRIETVLGNFNGALERSYVVFLDEAFFFGDRRHTEALKSLVTEPTIVINEKHQPSRQVESFHRFVIATNAEHVKHTDADDRRDLVLRVCDRHRSDSAYWTDLYAEIDGDGPAALMHMLLRRDISKFDVRRRPVTTALIDQRLQSLDDVGRWWEQCLRDGYIEGFGDQWPEFLPTLQALELIETFSGSRRYRRLTTQDVVKQLMRLCPSMIRQQRRLHGGRSHGFVLPSLEVARKAFEAYIGGEVPWES